MNACIVRKRCLLTAVASTALLGWLWAAEAEAGTVFRFVATEILAPPGGLPSILSPFSGEIIFDRDTVAAGEATIADVISINITAGIVTSTEDDFFSIEPGDRAFFSEDGSRITRFYSEGFWDAWFLDGDNMYRGELEIRDDLVWYVAAIGSPENLISEIMIKGFWTSQLGVVESAPIMPVNDQGPFQFELPLSESDVLGIDIPLFFDPIIAIGYEYTVDPGGVAFASVTMPESVPDPDGFELHVWNGEKYVFEASLMPGESYDFRGLDAEGLLRFKILGIDPALSLDPDDPLAFPTGLTFLSAGDVRFTMSPSVIPVPAPILLLLTGLGGLGLIGLRQRVRREALDSGRHLNRP